MARKPWGRVAVGTRLVANAPAEFIVSWSHLLLMGMRPGDSLLPMPIRTYHHGAANELVRHALRGEVDSILFVDSDQVFTADSLSRLRDNKHGKEYDIIMGLIAHRKNGLPLVMRSAGWDGPRPMFEHVTDYTPGHVVPVDVVGLGFTLMRMSVFDRIDEPWFSFPADTDTVGEDVWFCHKAREAGLRLAVDTSVEVGHLTNEPLTVSQIARARDDT